MQLCHRAPRGTARGFKEAEYTNDQARPAPHRDVILSEAQISRAVKAVEVEPHFNRFEFAPTPMVKLLPRRTDIAPICIPRELFYKPSRRAVVGDTTQPYLRGDHAPP